jgi:YVTN family beta-propeller protein
MEASVKRSLFFKLTAAGLVYFHLAWTTIVLAETSRSAGIVTAVSGDAILTRATQPDQSLPLKFRDELFFKDRIRTKERSIVRVLLGGKAVVTVRQLSELTISEDPKQPTVVNLSSGKIALDVARSLMKPGEAIEIHTPNAFAAIRGTMVVVEVLPAGEPGASGSAGAEPDYRPMRASQAVPVQAPTVVTNFHVLQGTVEVFSRTQPNAPPVTLGPGFSVSISGATLGQPHPSPPSQQLLQGLKPPPPHTNTPEETKTVISINQQTTATALANVIAPPQTQPQQQQQQGGGQQGGGDQTLTDASSNLTTDSNTPNTDSSQATAVNPLTQNVIIPTTGIEFQPVTITEPTPLISLTNTLVNLGSTSLATMTSGGATNEITINLSGLPMLNATGPSPDISGPLGGPTFQFTNSTITGDPGTPLFMVNGTDVTAQGTLLVASGVLSGEPLTIDAGSLLTLASSATIGGALELTNGASAQFSDDVISIPAGSTVTSTGTLFSLSGGSTLDTPSNLVFVGGAGATLSLAGPILSAMSGSGVSTGTFFLDVENGAAATSTGTGAFIQIDGVGSTLNAVNSDLVGVFGTGLPASSTLSLAGPLLSVTNGASVSIGLDLIDVQSGGAVTGTGTGAFIQVNGFGTTLSAPNDDLVLVSGSSTTLTLAGPLLSATNGASVSATALLDVQDGAAVTGTGTGAFIQVAGTGTTLTAGSGFFIQVIGTSTTLSLAGPLLSVTNGATVSAANNTLLLDVLDGATVTGTGSSAFIQVDGTGTTLSVPDHDIVRVRDPGSTLSLAGPLLSVTGGAGASVSDIILALEGGATVTGTGTSAFIQADGTGTTLSVSGDLVLVIDSGTTLNLAGPLLNVTNGASVNASGALDVQSGATVTGSGSSAFIQVDGTGSTLSVSQLVLLTGAGTTLGLSGPLLSVSNGGLVTTGTGTAPFIQVDGVGTSLTIGASLVSAVGSDTTLSLAGPLLSLTGDATATISTGTIFGRLLLAAGGSTSTGTGTAPFIQVDGAGTALTGNILVSVEDSGTTLSLAGPLLSLTNGSTINTISSCLCGILVGFSGGTVTGTGTAPFIQVDGTGTSLTIGSLVDLQQTGTTLSLAGPLLSLTNGSIVETDGLQALTGATITGTGSDAFIQVDGAGTALFVSRLVYLQDSGTMLSLAGSLISVTGGFLHLGEPLLTLTSGTPTATLGGDILNIGANGTVQGPPQFNGPLIDVASGSLNVTGSLVNLADATSVLNLTGPILKQTGGTVTTGTGLVLASGASLTPTDLGPAIGTVPVGTSPVGVAVSPNGATAYVTNQNSNTVSVINTATNTVSATVTVGSGPEGVAVSPNGATAYVANKDSNTVSVIDTTINTVSATVPVGSSPRGVAVSPNGTTAYVTNLSSNTVSVIDTTTNTVSATVTVGSQPLEVAVSPDGTRAYVANSHISSNTISVIDTATNTVSTVTVGSRPFGVAVSPNGARAYVTNFGDSTVSVIDTATNTVTATVPVGTSPAKVAISPDGTRAYVTNDGDNTVSVINTVTNTVSATVAVGTTPVGVAVSPDGATTYVTNLNSSTVSVLIGGAAPLFQVAGGTLTTTGNLVSIPATATLTLEHSLLHILNGGIVIANADAVNVAGTLDTGGAPILDLRGRGSATASETIDFPPSGAGLEDVTLTLGTDRPLRGPGTCPTLCPLANSIISADGATITTNQAVRLDTALLEATAPLINMINASTMTSNSDLINLANQAKLIGTVPGDALIKLDNSILNVTGSLFNVAGGSYLNVTGSLFSLNNTSTLTITNGALVALSGGSVFTLTGSFGSFGTGTNAISLPTSLSGYTINTTVIPGYGVALAGGATTAQISLPGTFTPFTGLGGSNTATTNGIVLKIADSTSKVKLCTSGC